MNKAQLVPMEKSRVEKEVTEILKSFNGSKDELIPILQVIQHKYSYLPEDAMLQVARFLKIPESSVFGVATFYSFFRLKPTGKNIIRVCRGTACHVRGAGQVLTEIGNNLGISSGESTMDLKYHLETVACIGACALAPTVMLNDITYGQMSKKKITEMFESMDERE